MKISFKSANEILKREGGVPFPIEEIEIPDSSEEEARISIQNYANQYERWMWKEWAKINHLSIEDD